MRGRFFLLVIIVAAATALAAGVLAAQANSPSDLPATTVERLLGDMAAHREAVGSVSGEVVWVNGLLGGDILALGEAAGAGANPSGIASFLQNGSGRVWLQDGKARLEAQSSYGDTVMVSDGRSVWLYDGQKGTATQYVLPPRSESGASPSPMPLPTADPTQVIAEAVARLAPTATLAVTGQERVAGRDSYILAMTPTADDTLFGVLKVAIDGHTFVPLRLQVFAKGATAPALEFGFASVSFDRIADDVFAFSPPPGTTVERHEIKLPEGSAASEGRQEENDETGGEGHEAAPPLTLEQAAAKAGFDLLVPADTAGKEFRGALVIDGQALAAALGPAAPDESGSPTAGSPTVVMAYGDGFGTVVLSEEELRSQDAAGLDQLRQQLPGLEPVNVGGNPGLALSTSLGSVVAWVQDGHSLVIAGSLPRDELLRIAGSVR